MINSIMKYKGYSALVRYSEDDDCLIGRILGINDIVSFEADSVKQIRAEFEFALNDYIKMCGEMGKEPDRPYSGKLVVRLPGELHKQLAVKAEAEGMSINDAIVAAVEKIFEETKQPRARSVRPKEKNRAKTAV